MYLYMMCARRIHQGVVKLMHTAFCYAKPASSAFWRQIATEQFLSLSLRKWTTIFCADAQIIIIQNSFYVYFVLWKFIFFILNLLQLPTPCLCGNQPGGTSIMLNVKMALPAWQRTAICCMAAAAAIDRRVYPHRGAIKSERWLLETRILNWQRFRCEWLLWIFQRIFFLFLTLIHVYNNFCFIYEYVHLYFNTIGLLHILILKCNI